VFRCSGVQERPDGRIGRSLSARTPEHLNT
jgi:hypothetical protein